MPWRKVLRIIYPTDLITLAYILVTGIYIIFCGLKLTDVQSHITARIGFTLIICFLIYLDYKFSNRLVRFLRFFYPLALLGYFYPEVDYLNNVFFRNFDPEVANLEVTIFGGHPSVWFAEYLPWKWFNDLMNLAYFSFYFLIFILAYRIYKTRFEKFPFVLFIICMSFYIYYFIFIIFPVAGPQFYLTPPDNQLPDAYIFREAIKIIHSMGERPAAAFPSSHVGITFILIYLASKFSRELLKWFIPIGILLVLSTVYIKAHYVIDVIGGFLSVPIIYWISSQAYSTITHELSQELTIHAMYERMKVKVLRLRNHFAKKK